MNKEKKVGGVKSLGGSRINRAGSGTEEKLSLFSQEILK